MILDSDNGMRLAIVHDNFAQMGGAERVTEAFHRTLPEADLISTLMVQDRLTPHLKKQKIRTTWMQYLPWKARLFRHYFLLYPFAVEGINLEPYDLVITSCFGYAKGVRRRKGAVHICYCHNPMRWVWRTEDYVSREGMSPLKRMALRLLLKPLKAWEMRAAKQPDVYIANSTVVAERLKSAFGIDSEVIPPPIDTARFRPREGEPLQPGEFYLVLSRLATYKRTELAVEACTRLGRKLVVIGDGPDRKRLEAMAGPTVTFMGRLPDPAVEDHVRRCTALLFPGEEDFGMAPLEINAAGKPVIAFRGGGATETVREGINGIFFDEPKGDSLADAIVHFEGIEWNASVIREHAESFSLETFQQRFFRVLNRVAPDMVHVRS